MVHCTDMTLGAIEPASLFDRSDDVED